MSEEENKEISLPAMEIKGKGIAEDKVDSDEIKEFDPQPISYGIIPKDEKDPMEEFAKELISINDDDKVTTEVDKVTTEVDKSIVESPNDSTEILNTDNIVEVPDDELPKLSESKKVPFNPTETQSPLEDGEKEGGVVPAKSTGPTMTQRPPETKSFNQNPDGGQIKPTPDMLADSIEGKFEITGFTVNYEVSNGQMASVQIRDYFNDIDTAFASINGPKYLMPMKSGYKVATINSGAPIICYNERQIYIYKDGEWKRS